ncbi:DUF5050 domain-containing protein [Paenibacillus macquariensis]|uniref:DUF5050 domain-containing protein n=1 Tax=Paenibacillus macquariensis TaxID=948756 RepID=UPI0014833666|nr:DUF5050 domain-containing protein [Paenibacillus macquariensis]MEC0094379.1 DUF5050 domain-containing protein [Paenibacillus macquariensis]
MKQEPGSDVIMGQIVKVKADGSELTEVTKQYTYSGLTVDGKIIYFGGYDKDYNYQIGSMNLDGTGEKILLPNPTFWSYVMSKGNVFYVDTDNSLLYRLKFDGNGKPAISTKIVEPRVGGYLVR